MDLELYSIMAATVLITSVGTVIFAILAYVMFRVQEGRAARTSTEGGARPVLHAGKSQFFKPYDVSKTA